MALDVKICGLKTVDAIDAAIAAGATHCGFIFFEKSPRHLQIAQAMALRPAIGDRARLVAVSVDAGDNYLDDIVEATRPAMLQLHGFESPKRVAEVKLRYRLPVMKALPVREAADLTTADDYRGIADRFLFDAKPPSGATRPGGNAVSFDWRLLEALDADVEYMLSGGLNATNIAEALAHADPAGIDISSGVESAPGVKDAGLIAAFFEALGEARAQVA